MAEVGAGHRLTDKVRLAFESRFGEAEASRVARAPGRINLIGEHIDYCGLPVLPLAIDRTVRVTFRPAPSSRCRFTNVDPAYGERMFDLARLDDAIEPGDWGTYLVAAARELVDRHGLSVGIDALVSSDLPIAAGLSSSSALVIAAGLALIDVNGLDVAPLDLAEAMAAAERHTGTRGGGMDQAVSLMAEEGHACVIEFSPLAVRPVPLPPDWRFVVADSLVPAEKSGAAQAAYNEGPVVAHEALAAIAEGLETGGLAEPTYRGLISEHGVSELLSRARVAALDGLHFRRFRHVVTESDRVRVALTAMREGDLEAFGTAMNSSHESLRDDCGVSCPELDEIVRVACDAGAAGARLTGAGFGGCAIALCTAESAPLVREALNADFYSPRGVIAGVDAHLFLADSGPAASVVATS